MQNYHGDLKVSSRWFSNFDQDCTDASYIQSNSSTKEDIMNHQFEELNQNRAVGTDSEMTSYTPGIATAASDAKAGHLFESELRGGSTVSDLHNTEYIDETGQTAIPMKSNRFSPIKQAKSRHIKKSTTSDGTDRGSGTTADRTGTVRPSMESGADFADEDLNVQELATRESKQEAKSPQMKQRISSSRTQNTRVSSKPMKAESWSAASKQIGKEEKTAQSVDSPIPSPTLSSSMHSRKYNLGRRTTKSPERGTSQEPDRSDSESGSERSVTASSLAFLLEPDPTSFRDLDNASPETIELCNRNEVHYCFFVYFPPATVDENLLPFRRKAFADRVSRLQDPDQIKEVMDTRCGRDAFLDRRIKSIERRSGTEIRLSELHPSTPFVKGLPRRRLTIAGPSFANVCCALTFFESLLPNVVKAAIFPYRLPEGSSTRFCTGNRYSSTHNWSQERQNGTVFLRKQFDDKGGWRRFIVRD